MEPSTLDLKPPSYQSVIQGNVVHEKAERPNKARNSLMDSSRKCGGGLIERVDTGVIPGVMLVELRGNVTVKLDYDKFLQVYSRRRTTI